MQLDSQEVATQTKSTRARRSRGPYGQRAPGLKEARRKALLTQMELSNASGVSRATIAHLEGGVQNAKPSTLRKLAYALGVEPEELLEEESET